MLHKTLENVFASYGLSCGAVVSPYPLVCPLAHYRYCSDKPLSHLKRAADDLPWKCKIFAFILQQGRCVQVYLVILLLRCLQHLQMWLDRLSLSQGSVLANTRSPPCQSTQPKLLIC